MTPTRPPRSPPATNKTGCQWKALPKDLPAWDGTLDRIHHVLYVEVGDQVGREASPTTAIIDIQTAKGAVNVWPAPRLQAVSAL